MSSSHLILCLPFSSCPKSFPASGFFPMNQLFSPGGQSIGVSASVLPMNIQGWFPVGLTGLISLQSKGLLSLLQHHSWKASVFWHSAFFKVQLAHPYVTTGKISGLHMVAGSYGSSFCFFFLIKGQKELPCDPAIPLIGIYPEKMKSNSKRYMFLNV